MKITLIIIALIVGIIMPALGAIMLLITLFLGGVWVLGWLSENLNGTK